MANADRAHGTSRAPGRPRATVLGAALAFATLLATLPAQAPAGDASSTAGNLARAGDPIRPASSERPRRRPLLTRIDRVVAVIANEVILESEIERDVRDGAIRDLTAQEREQYSLYFINRRLHRVVFAVRGEARGSEHAPDQFRQQVDRLVDERIEELEQLEGGTAKLRSKLAGAGRSIEDIRSATRQEFLANYGQQVEINDKIRDHGNSLSTPREEYAYFKEHRDEFHVPARAEYEYVAVFLDGRQGDRLVAYRERLQEATQRWERGDTDARALAEEFDNARAVPQQALLAGDGTMPFLEPLAFGDDDEEARPEGSVCYHEKSGIAYLVRILGTEPAKVPSFSDPLIQRRIRSQLQNEHIERLRQQAVQRNVRKIAIYPPRLEATLHAGYRAGLDPNQR